MASFSKASARPGALLDVFCLLPKELLLLLRCCSNLSEQDASSLLVTNREAAMTISALQATDIQVRLGSTVAQAVENGGSGGGGVGGASKQGIVLTRTEAPEDMPLLSGLDAASAEEEVEVPGTSDLTALLWLVNAARTTLKSVHESDQISRSSAAIRELASLRDNLLAKRELIANSLLDFKRLQQWNDQCLSYRAQIQIVSEKLRALREKNGSGNNNSSSSQSSSGAEEDASSWLIALAKITGGQYQKQPELGNVFSPLRTTRNELGEVVVLSPANANALLMHTDSGGSARKNPLSLVMQSLFR